MRECTWHISVLYMYYIINLPQEMTEERYIPQRKTHTHVQYIEACLDYLDIYRYMLHVSFPIIISYSASVYSPGGKF